MLTKTIANDKIMGTVVDYVIVPNTCLRCIQYTTSDVNVECVSCRRDKDKEHKTCVRYEQYDCYDGFLEMEYFLNSTQNYSSCLVSIISSYEDEEMLLDILETKYPLDEQIYIVVFEESDDEECYFYKEKENTSPFSPEVIFLICLVGGAGVFGCGVYMACILKQKIERITLPIPLEHNTPSPSPCRL